MKFLLFDTETTGLVLPSNARLDVQPRIIEYYAMLCDEEGEILEEVDELINPGFPLSPEITKITGLRDKDVEDKPPFAAFADRIAEQIGKANAVVAHNLKFDFAVVGYEFERLGRKVPWPLGRLCTVEQTEHIKGKRLSLTNLYQHLFDETFPSAHRAKNDVMALRRCFFHMRTENII